VNRVFGSVNLSLDEDDLPPIDFPPITVSANSEFGGLVVMRWPVTGTKGGMFLLPTMARQLARLLTQAADDLESLT
jgi:hypothetical protein